MIEDKSPAKVWRRGGLAVAAIAVFAVLVAWQPVFQAGEGRAYASAAYLGQCGESSVSLVGFSDALNKTSFGDFNVSELSGITYDRTTGMYYAVADRAGSVRSHFFTLDIPVPFSTLAEPRVTDVTVLTNAAGTPYTGANLDAEGIDIVRGGDIAVASEGGSAAGEQPEIRLFSRAGTELGALSVPSKFLIGTNNLSFESLSVSPSRHSIFTAMEAPLAADGRTSDLRSRVRIVKFSDLGDGSFAPVAEYFYLTEPGRTTGDLGVAEMLALSDSDVMVLERGFVAGQGNTIRIFRAQLLGETDVSDEPSLNGTATAPVAKELVVDLATCPSAGATSAPGAIQPNPLLDNFEAMTFGPRLMGGVQTLVLVSDDNGAANQTTRIVVLAVPEPEVVGQD